MILLNPHLLPKVRSEKIMDAPVIFRREFGQSMPCTLRVASFVGLTCADDATVVMAHTSNAGKGTSTKTSDLEAVAGCSVCHRILDEPSPAEFQMLHQVRGGFVERVRLAGFETRAMMVMAGIIVVPDGKII